MGTGAGAETNAEEETKTWGGGINSYLSHVLRACNGDDGTKYWQSGQIHQSLLFLARKAAHCNYVGISLGDSHPH